MAAPHSECPKAIGGEQNTPKTAAVAGYYTPGSRLPGDHSPQVQLTLGSHNGQPVLQVVVYEVADAFKQHVLRPHLWAETSAPIPDGLPRVTLPPA